MVLQRHRINNVIVKTRAGVMLEYFIGSFLDWDKLAFFNATMPAIALLLAFFIPESPSWLISSKNDEIRCRASLRRVRDSKCDVDTEFNDLLMSTKTDESTTFKEKLRLISRPSAYKPFIIVSIYFLLSQFSGLNVVTFYAVDVIRVSVVALIITSALLCIICKKCSALLRHFYRIRVLLLTNTWPPSYWDSFGWHSL